MRDGTDISNIWKQTQRVSKNEETKQAPNYKTTKLQEKNISETESSNLLGKEFKALVIIMLSEHGRRIQGELIKRWKR